MTMVITMKTLAAAQFKAKCLKIMDDVHRTREAVIITKNGVRYSSGQSQRWLSDR
jgi:PHD/YefM family antitoxin component YafN of YafNO toxin-antitoxin module